MTSIVELYASLFPIFPGRHADRPADHGLRGGCSCGRLDYRLAPAAIERPAGDGLIAAAAGLRFVTGRPRAFRVADGGQRLFCRHCGTLLARTLADRPGQLALQVATLDEPEELARIVTLRPFRTSAGCAGRAARSRR